MYLVRDKKTKAIIHVNPAPLRQKLEPEQVYFRFDPATMEIGKADGRLPEHYEIDDDGMIVELTMARQVELNIIELSDNEVVVNNRIETIPRGMKVQTNADGEDEIVSLTLAEKIEKGLRVVDEPFEFFDAEKGVIETRDLTEIADMDLVSNAEIAGRLAQKISNRVAAEIAETIPHRIEMKIVKGYMDWIVDGQPEKDSRQKNYQTMQKAIEQIKKRYAPAKRHCRAKMKSGRPRA